MGEPGQRITSEILPSSLAADADRLARFQREAEVLASLNHPNIAAIYGLEESGDVRALVMELVEGPTLADRIAQRPIPLDEVLPIATQISFQSDRDGDLGIWWQAADGGTAERLTTAGQREEHIPESWSPDGTRLLYAASKPSTFASSLRGDLGRTFALWALTIADKKTTLVEDVRSFAPPGSVFSPDGRWVAYHFSEGGARRNTGVYVMPFPATGVRVQAPKRLIDSHPVWAPNGTELFYQPVSGSSLVAVTVRTQQGVTLGNPVELQGVPNADLRNGDPRAYDILPDGRFIVAAPAAGQGATGTSEAPEIRVVLNWFEELKRLVPAR